MTTPRTTTTRTTMTMTGTFLALAALVALSGTEAAARRPAKPALADLEAEAKRLEGEIDQDVQWLFRYQVEGGWYRSRLLGLQGQWKEMLTKFGVQAPTPVAKSKYEAPPTSGFRIDEAVGSEQLSLEKALAQPGCKLMRACKLWLRISFGKEYLTKQARFEVSADLTSTTGQRYAVPTKEFSVKQAVEIVDVPLDRIYLPKGKNSGTVKVLGEQTFRRRRFTLDINR